LWQYHLFSRFCRWICLCFTCSLRWAKICEAFCSILEFCCLWWQSPLCAKVTTGGQKQVQDSSKHATGNSPIFAMHTLAVLLQAAANILINKCDQDIMRAILISFASFRRTIYFECQKRSCKATRVCVCSGLDIITLCIHKFKIF
jgi:hypothetical protein